MVLAGEAGGGDREEVKVCAPPWQRQHVHRQRRGQSITYLSTAEVLPVVELKPFTKKVWRRDCSLPTFQPSPAPREEQGAGATAPNMSRFIQELEEQRRLVVAQHSSRSSSRPRAWLHPKAGGRLQATCRVLHQKAFVPSFSSRHQRSRASLEEETGEVGGRERAARESEEGVSRQSSCLMAAYTRDKPLHQEEVCLLGDRLQTGNTGRRHLAYLSPHPAPQKSFSILQNTPADLNPDLPPSPAHIAPESLLAAAADNLPQPSPNGLSYANGAADSSYLGNKAHLVLAGSPLQAARDTWAQQMSESGAGGSSSPGGRAVREGNPHKFNSKLGAARDSLSLLSQSGTPTVVERHLTFQQDVRLQRCRRERSLAAVMDFSLLPGSHFVTFDSSPTPGELLLQQARDANRQRDSRRTHKTPTTSRRTGRFWGIVGSSAQGLAVGNSPRSLQCHAGDSLIVTTPGRREEGALTHRDAEGQTHLKGDASQNAKVWAETVQGDEKDRGKGMSLREPSEAQHRPHSDTALADSVHVRNEQTAMSADNRARLLPTCLPQGSRAAEDAASQHSMVYDDSHSSVSSLSAAERGLTPHTTVALQDQRPPLPATNMEQGQGAGTQLGVSSSTSSDSLLALTPPAGDPSNAAPHTLDHVTSADTTSPHATTNSETPVQVTAANRTVMSEAGPYSRPETMLNATQEAPSLEHRASAAQHESIPDPEQAFAAGGVSPSLQVENMTPPMTGFAEEVLCESPPAASGSEECASLHRPVHSDEVSESQTTEQPPGLGTTSTENNLPSPAVCVSDTRTKDVNATDMADVSAKTEQLDRARTLHGNQQQTVEPAGSTRVASLPCSADSASRPTSAVSEGKASSDSESGAAGNPEPSASSHPGDEQQLTDTCHPNMTQWTATDSAADGGDTEPRGDFTPQAAVNLVTVALETIEAGNDFEGRQTFLTTSIVQPAYKEIS